MTGLFSSRRWSGFSLWIALFALSAAVFPPTSRAQSAADSADAGGPVGHGRILLVLPFDNLTDQAALSAAGPAASQNGTPVTGGAGSEQSNLDWIREAAPEVLNSRMTSAGFAPLSREDRLYALDHLGLPETFQPSRATALRLAQTLDADYILIGSFSASGTRLTIKGRVVDVARLRLSDEITEMGEISQLIPLLNSLSWQLARKLDPAFGVAEETFRAAGSKVRLDAFEQYVRGLTEPGADERLRHLKRATELSPDFTEAWVATGKLQFDSQQFEEAAVSFARVKRGDPAELEAGFYRGLSLIYSGSYARAEDSFAAVARVLPLPEVVNNEAVAVSRRGKDAIALFRQAEAADPSDEDYHFNLAVSLNRHGDKAEALNEMDQALKLRATDSEARAVETAWKAAPAAAAATGIEPLERIKRAYNGAAFRQAALMMDQMEAARLQALPGADRAAKLSSAARANLDRGLLLEAEREFQAAMAADDRSAEAHAGLAEVRERAGDNDSARKEAHAAIDRRPNLEAYLVLARLDLAANRLTDARDDTAQALQLDGNNKAAKDLRKSIDTHLQGPGAAPAVAPVSTAKPE